MKWKIRGVAIGEARGAPEFGRSVNPIQTRGADYAPHTTASPPPPRNQKAIYTSAIPWDNICEFMWNILKGQYTTALHVSQWFLLLSDDLIWQT